MRGHIEQRSKGSWSISIYYGKDNITNKKIYKWFTVKGTKKDAEKFLNEKLNEIQNGIFIDSKSMTFGDYLEYWYKECCFERLSPTTYESYRRNMDNHILQLLGNIKLDTLQPLHLQTFYSNRLENGLSKTTVLYLHRIIHKALQQAMKWQLVSRNIADNVEPPKPEKYNASILNEDDLSVMIDKLKNDTELYVPVMIAISTGMRRGEILGLTWNNVDLINGYIKVVQALYPTKNGLVFLPPKTQKSIRTITIPPKLIEILNEHKNKQREISNKITGFNKYNLVCCDIDGQPINPDSITWKFRNFLKRNKLKKIRFHDLRHSHASLLLKQGVQAKYISERLGHSNINITMDLYSHTYEDKNKEIANNFNVFLD